MTVLGAKPKPFRLRAPVVAEDDIHTAVAKALDVLLLPPAVWTCFPAGNIPLPAIWAAKLARMGLKRGWPDILILCGKLYGIELKRVGGTLSKTRMVRSRRGGLREVVGQVEVFPRLLAAGFAAIVVCHSVDEVIAAARSLGLPLRPTY